MRRNWRTEFCSQARRLLEREWAAGCSPGTRELAAKTIAECRQPYYDVEFDEAIHTLYTMLRSGRDQWLPTSRGQGSRRQMWHELAGKVIGRMEDRGEPLRVALQYVLTESGPERWYVSIERAVRWLGGG